MTTESDALIRDCADAIQAATDPWYSLKHNFGFEPGPYQRKVGNYLFNDPKPRIIFVGANESGKTYGLAHLMDEYFHQYDDAEVIATSTSRTQLRYQLWGKSKKAAAHIQKKLGWEFLPEAMLCRSWDEDHRMIGYRPGDSAEKSPDKSPFEGFHGKHLLIVADEARGLPAYIYEAIDSCNPHAVILLSVPGNPSKGSDLYQAWTLRKPDGSYYWRRVQVNAYDSPWTDPEWIQYMELKYGRNHPVFRRRVLSEFCAWTEHGFFRWHNPKIGEHDARHVDAAFTSVSHPAGRPRVLAIDPGATSSLTWGVELCGGKWTRCYVAPGGADMETVGVIMKWHKAHPYDAIPVDEGLGAGMIDRFKELKAPVEAVRFKSAGYGNKNQMMGWLRSAFERSDLDLRYHPALDKDHWTDMKEQVLGFQEVETSAGNIRLQHAAGMHDDAVDALAMAWATVMGKIRPVKRVRRMRHSIGRIS